MKKIAISQRVEEIKSYHESRDCLDQNWTVLLGKLGMLVIPIPNTLDNPVVWLRTLQVDGVILSGGNDLSLLPGANNTSEARDRTEMLLLEYLATTEIPVLGVCRGMQIIHHYCGGQLIPIQNHSAREHSIRLIGDSNKLKESGYKIIEQVNSYHNWGIELSSLPYELIPLAEDQVGHVEAFKYKSRQWWGIMWHPERKNLTEVKDKAFLKRIFKVS